MYYLIRFRVQGPPQNHPLCAVEERKFHSSKGGQPAEINPLLFACCSAATLKPKPHNPVGLVFRIWRPRRLDSVLLPGSELNSLSPGSGLG